MAKLLMPFSPPIFLSIPLEVGASETNSFYILITFEVLTEHMWQWALCGTMQVTNNRKEDLQV